MKETTKNYSDFLLQDKDAQSSLKDAAKLLFQEIFTFIIGIHEGLPVKNWTPEIIARVNNYRNESFKNKELIKNNTIEFSDAVCLLQNYYTAKGSDYSNALKEKISSEQESSEQKNGNFNEFKSTESYDESKFNANYNKSKFNANYNRRCEQEQTLLNKIREIRNEKVVHFIELMNMGELYIWIQYFMKYMECFLSYHMGELSQYDARFGKESDRTQLDKYYLKIAQLKERCFCSTEDIKKTYKIFKFQEKIYKISKNKCDLNDFELLIMDMARNWDKGILYLLNETSRKEFHDFLEEYADNQDDVILADLKIGNIINAQDDVGKSIFYMSLLYQCYHELPGLFWKGKQYSESYFASMVLQILTRHPDAFDFSRKKETLIYRINNSQNWKESNEKQKGIGINVILLCKEHILSRYFKGQEDKDGIKAAANFENVIIECSKSEDYVDTNYDDIMNTILTLTAYMKGETSYMLPIGDNDEQIGKKNYKIFKTPNEFRTYVIALMKSKRFEEIVDFVYKIQSDYNLKWFLKNYEKYKSEETEA